MRRKFVPIALTLAVVLLALDVALRLDGQAHAQPQIQIAPTVVAAEIDFESGGNTAGTYRIIRAWSDGAMEFSFVNVNHANCFTNVLCDWVPIE